LYCWNIFDFSRSDGFDCLFELCGWNILDKYWGGGVDSLLKLCSRYVLLSAGSDFVFELCTRLLFVIARAVNLPIMSCWNIFDVDGCCFLRVLFELCTRLVFECYGSIGMQ
jgi:hypothetical protein